MSRLSIRLFGYPRFGIDQQPIKVERRKTLALAAYLALEGAQRGLPRERIADLFWPDCSQEQAGAYLRQALWDFSKAAGEGWIAREEKTISFRPQAEIWVDVNAFSAQTAGWKAGEQVGAAAVPLLSELASLYQDDFLAGFNLRDCPAFDDWQVFQAETLRLRLAQVLEALMHAQAGARLYNQAAESARRWLALDPLNEETHQALMRLYATQGDRAAVRRQFETLTRLLADELGVEPGVETRALFQDLQEPSSPQRPSLEGLRPVNLPVQMTPFVGREEELARIEELLDEPDCRIVSLVGMGGSGKTRLAIQAAGLTRYFADGITFVGLAAANSLEQMIPAIAEALKLAFQNEPGSNLKLEAAQRQLFNYLAGKQILMVLDNFEQLTACADFLIKLLDVALGLKLIITTRERLNLRGETVVEVGGLAFPVTLEGLDQADAQRQAAQSAGVQLFVKSAARAGRFDPGPEDWPAILRICRLVEGAPLGVEMAAAWTRTLSCAEIAAEIEQDLDFLQAGWRGMPQRQSTYRAIFEHSWQLLSERDRAVFSRLSIFRAGFKRPFALEVAAAPLAALTSLIDKSLVRRLSSGRYEIHPVLRPYAAEKLAQNPAALAETSLRYAACYLDWLHEQFKLLKGRQQLEALTALRAETQDVYAAWHILIENRNFERLQAGLPAAVLFNFMNDRRVETHEFDRLLFEMLSWLRPPGDVAAGKAASSDASTHPELLALTLAAYRHYILDSSDIQLSVPVQKESLELARSMPEDYVRASVLMLNSVGSGYLTSSEGAENCLQSYRIFKSLQDDWGCAMAQLVRADCLAFGSQEFELAHASYQASLESFDRQGNLWGRALCLCGLSIVERQAGRLPEAFNLASQSLELFEQLDNQERISQIRLYLAEIAEKLNDLENARRYYAVSQAHFKQRGEEQKARYFQERVESMDRKLVESRAHSVKGDKPEIYKN